MLENGIEFLLPESGSCAVRIFHFNPVGSRLNGGAGLYWPILAHHF
jgi:hypothetical protein